MTNKCFVPNCKSGLESLRKQYRKENKKPPQVFGAPKHWTMLQVWSHVIPVWDKKFSITDRMCELHFIDDYISKYHELTLEDGKMYKIERKFVKLKPGGIPTVFAEFPEYSLEVQKIVAEMRNEYPLHVSEMDLPIDDRMKIYLKRITELQKRLTSVSETPVSEAEKSVSIDNPDDPVDKLENANETKFSDDELDSEVESMTDVNFATYSSVGNVATTDSMNSEHEDIETEGGEHNLHEEFTFDVLVRNLKSVARPNSAWSLTAHGIFIMCAKWNKDYQPEKRVVIDRELNVKVFLNENEIATYSNCISDVSDISNILRILDK